MHSPELTPFALARVLASGFYVLGGELLWISIRWASRLILFKKADTWRGKQLARRKKLFFRDTQESA